MNSKSRRKTLIVEEKLQMMIIKTIVTYGIILSAVFLMGLYFITNQFIKTIFQASTFDDNLKLTLYSQLNYIVLIFFGFAVVLTFATSYFSLLFSNKIAGPIYKINLILEKNLTEGTSELVKIRDDDYFQPLASNINKILASRKL